MSNTYIGIVVREGYERVQVHIPELDGITAFGSMRTFGKAQGNCMGMNELMILREKCKYASVAMSGIASGGVSNYDEKSGGSKAQDSYRAQPMDLTKDINPPMKYHTANEGRSFISAATNCAKNFISTYILDDTNGSKINREENKPKGTFSKLLVGQRVIVQSYNNGTNLIITGTAPWDGEASLNTKLS